MRRRHSTGRRAAAAARSAGLVVLAVSALVAVGCWLPSPAGAAGGSIEIPAYAAGSVSDLLVAVGALPDRRLVSRVPGPVRNVEAVTALVGADGTVSRVEVTQRLRLSGTGDYQIRERGPARAARALDGTLPPVVRRGTVVWQGFSPGRRDLAAGLLLDPGLESARLPLGVTLSFRPAAGGAARQLAPGARAPAAGTVTVTLTDQSVTRQSLPTGVAVPALLAPSLAPSLDRLRAAATAGAQGAALPTGGAGLPTRIAVDAPGTRTAPVSTALRIDGTLGATSTTGTTGSVPDKQVRGPGLRPLPAGGAEVHGTLAGGSVRFEVDVDAAATLRFDLVVRPVLDPRPLRPPGSARTWTAWAATPRTAAERRAATDLLVTAAAAAARARSYAPYLGADLAGPTTTTFRYRPAPAPVAVAVVEPLRRRPARLVLVGLAAAAIAANAVALWRIS